MKLVPEVISRYYQRIAFTEVSQQVLTEGDIIKE
jgi:hypothetical protein